MRKTSSLRLLNSPFVGTYFAGAAVLLRAVFANLQWQENDALQIRRRGDTPLIISNMCGDTIYPGIVTQSGTGPGTGGFELASGGQQTLSVSEDWQGRVWGRTNCSFNGGSSGQCGTGDCGGVISCSGTGNVPVSLAEFTLDAGDGHTYYDISLVDGYNLPLAIIMHPLSNSSFLAIPPNLTNPSCVASAGEAQPPGYNPYGGGTFLDTNSSDPLPFEESASISDIGSWCPWSLQLSASSGPSNGVYQYPDGNLQRPGFDPCYSACAKSHSPKDCCTGSYSSPSTCLPSTYSKAAKAICPDAYSYAFDDQSSTFIIPAGAGFEVRFCPGGRSTNILATSGALLVKLAQEGHVKRLSAMQKIASMHWTDALYPSLFSRATVLKPACTLAKLSSMLAAFVVLG